MKAKRLFDIVAASACLLLCLPLLVIIAALIFTDLKSPILFRQQRLGRKNKVFLIYKFRTMTDKHDPSGPLLTSQQRVTPLGKWLRSTSLDELPQLWNVLKGEMSLVGPRPLLVTDLSGCLATQAKRHSVAPGITGWAQINGRNNLSLQEKLMLDLWYIDNRSFWLDCKILLLTIKPVLLRKNI